MFFDGSYKSPMLFGACRLSFPASSLHINLRAFMLRFTNVTFSYLIICNDTLVIMIFIMKNNTVFKTDVSIQKSSSE